MVVMTAHPERSADRIRGLGATPVRGDVQRPSTLRPALEGAEPVSAYAGLRPAGRGVNYVIGPSPACPQLVNVAAIRSTGLSASLGIGEHVAELLEQQGVAA